MYAMMSNHRHVAFLVFVSLKSSHGGKQYPLFLNDTDDGKDFTHLFSLFLFVFLQHFNGMKMFHGYPSDSNPKPKK